jgi:predicted ATPase with chaperone activity
VPAGALGRYTALDAEALDAWHLAVEDQLLTGRGGARIRRVARTLADLDDAPAIGPQHVALAASLRGEVP